MPDPVVKKEDKITQDLGAKEKTKNEFIVNSKISKIEVHGLDPFCRIEVKKVKELQTEDKAVAIPLYRQEAGDRMMKKIQETKSKKEIVKSENYNEWIEKQKKEEEAKDQRDKDKQNLTSAMIVTKNLGDMKRFSRMASAGSMFLGIDRLIRKAEEQISTERPLNQDDNSPRNLGNLKKGYKKNDYIPNLQRIQQKDKTVKNKDHSATKYDFDSFRYLDGDLLPLDQYRQYHKDLEKSEAAAKNQTGGLQF